MTNLPYYNSVKITLEAWKALTRICAETGEPRTKALTRIILDEEKRLIEEMRTIDAHLRLK
jgi:hypothetical protein